jgi:hypothetical protein
VKIQNIKIKKKIMFSLIMTWQQLVIALESNGSGPLPRWIKNKNNREKTPSGCLG